MTPPPSRLRAAGAFCIFAFLAAATLGCGRRAAVPDEDYLRGVARETWDYLAAHVDPTTGFPTEAQYPGGGTNTTNVGLYLAALGPAVEMGYCDRADAVARARKVVASVGRLEHRHGFLPNWISVSGDTAIPPGVFAVSDFNKLVAGLVLVRVYFPELAPDVAPLIDRVEWSWLYHAPSKGTYWGYDLLRDERHGGAPLWLMADTRMASFFLIATGAAPAESWDLLARQRIEADGLTFFYPGYEWGGLFMQAMCGIFLDERGTDVGRSVADLAWHQIRSARARGLPAWAWSNCNVPNAGYTEGGFLPWWVVTPHAAALVIEYYPRHAVANLKALEAMGLRKPLAEGDTTAWGFRDSIDLRSNIADRRWLALDQGMLFLALANRLEDGLVRRRFAEDPLVRRGLDALGDRLKPDPAALAEWARRDASEPEPVALPAPPDTDVAFDLRTDTTVRVEATALGGGARIDAKRTPRGVEIEFDLGPEGAGECDATLVLPAVDARGLDVLTLVASGARLDGQKSPWGFRVHLRDDQGQTQLGFVGAVPARADSIPLPDYARLGLFARPQAVTRLTIKFWGRPWFYSVRRTEARKGRLILERVVFGV